MKGHSWVSVSTLPIHPLPLKKTNNVFLFSTLTREGQYRVWVCWTSSSLDGSLCLSRFRCFPGFCHGVHPPYGMLGSRVGWIGLKLHYQIFYYGVCNFEKLLILLPSIFLSVTLFKLCFSDLAGRIFWKFIDKIYRSGFLIAGKPAFAKLNDLLFSNFALVFFF